MENGELGIWDPSKIVAQAKYVYTSLFCGWFESDVITPAHLRLSYSRIPRTLDQFVDWISIPSNLLCLPPGVSMERYFFLSSRPQSGSSPQHSQIYIWDLKDPSKPYSPGTRSSKLDEVGALAWNNQVPHVLATSSGTGYTVVWDLRGKREVVALAYGGGAGTQAGSGRRGMSDVAWHPDNVRKWSLHDRTCANMYCLGDSTSHFLGR